MLDGDRLAFSRDEAARFAEAARLDVAERELGRLLHDTEGWAFALCSAIRDCASTGRPLEGAFERWRRANGRLVRHFVDAALADEDPLLAAAARKLFDGENVAEATLDRLEARGVFVRWADGAYRPYRAIARVTRAAAPAPARALAPFTVRLFGKNDVRIEGQQVAWFRRRDAQIFAFLALQPQGRARRETLIRVFWPSADRQLAGQSLRSACSTMRRSLAAVVGYADLAHYVAFGDEIALNLELFAVDARRVRSHLRDAEHAWAAGDVAGALDHDRAALRLAGEPLLEGDVPPALSGIADELHDGLARAAARAGDSAARRLVRLAHRLDGLQLQPFARARPGWPPGSRAELRLRSRLPGWPTKSRCGRTWDSAWTTRSARSRKTTSSGTRMPTVWTAWQRSNHSPSSGAIVARGRKPTVRSSQPSQRRTRQARRGRSRRCAPATSSYARDHAVKSAVAPMR